MRPVSVSTRSMTEAQAAGSVTSWGRNVAPDLRRGLAALVDEHIGEVHPCTLGREECSFDSPPGPVRPAGDDGHLAVELPHLMPPFRVRARGVCVCVPNLRQTVVAAGRRGKRR